MSFRPLDKPAQYLKGVGPARAEALAKLGVKTARDLLYHVPRRYDDASTIHPVARLEVGMDATAAGRVRSKGVIPTRSGLRIFQIVLQDDTGMITCAWPGQPWLDRSFREGDFVLVTGPVKFFHGRQIQPREFTILARGDEAEELDEAEGVIFVSYPATEEISQGHIRRIFRLNLDWMLESVEEEEHLGAGLRDRLDLPDLREAFRKLHRPREVDEAEAGRRRLAWDELFALQLLQARSHHLQTEERPGIVFRRTNALIRPLHHALPFELTDAQVRVLREIYDDMTSRRRMNRLLQGDVGSGKTVVALFAMLLAAESGLQAALMAPTEILAEQHARTLRELLEPLDVEPALLTGHVTGAERRRVLEGLASGEIGLAVGTHALIQDAVEFDSLGLAVVDEQHRFGVRQRMALGESGERPDVLVMSATPIPRSMALTLHGDLDLSILDELPPGRRPVETRLHASGERDDVWNDVRRELEAGRQAYVVYPLVSESETLDLRSATEEYERLARDVFPRFGVGLLHGQLASEEKDRVMRSFLAGDVDVLVATSVVEVGLDVANATVMVIEHAERFGLSQLHQLRGRVGRGGDASYCHVLADPGAKAEERLKIFASTNDGYAIARADLRIRGQGDLFGEDQHGQGVSFRFVDLERDEELVIAAHRLARRIVADDPELERPEHASLRRHLEEHHGERMKLHDVG